MNSNNFITWEQATKLNVLQPVAEQYEAQILEILHFFGKDTSAQLAAMDLYMEAMELYEVYEQKDYSQYLFQKTEELFKALESQKDQLARFKEICQAAAKAVSEVAQKTKTQ